MSRKCTLAQCGRQALQVLVRGRSQSSPGAIGPPPLCCRLLHAVTKNVHALASLQSTLQSMAKEAGAPSKNICPRAMEDLIGRTKQPVIYHKVCHGLPGGDLVGVAERPDINVPMCGQAARTASAKTPEFLQQHLLYGRGPDRVCLSHVESLANKLDPPRDCEGSSYFFTEGN
jgi:hypothetical protein